MRIGIVGLGLIGGSLALDLRSRGFEVYGVDLEERTCQIAIEIGAVDLASISPNFLSTADIIFICTPLDAITPTLKQLIPHLSPETIITDVGSVKTPIVQECSQLWTSFVGGHPMAGTAEQGIEAAKPDLFLGASYVLTPTETTPSIASQRVEEIAQLIGANVLMCSPEAHDQAVAWISHLPVMISASLIDACLHETDSNILQLAQQLASSGFCDTSRVGGGNPQLGVMMARDNRKALLRSLFEYRHSLNQLIEVIEKEDWERLEQILTSTQQTRTKFC